MSPFMAGILSSILQSSKSLGIGRENSLNRLSPYVPLGLSGLLLCAVVTGCTTLKPAHFKLDSEVLSGRHHTFAVYNDHHRLISDPLSELYTEVQDRKNQGRPISDVYVISHGWNFTTPEAYANYHNYMELLDRHLQELTAIDPTYEPYFIYVVWPSVARPLNDIAHAVLPFGLDNGIAPVTSRLDMLLFQLPSGWKESINAFSVALGTRYPRDYEKGLEELGKLQPTQPLAHEDPSPPYCGPVEQRGEKKAVDLYEIDTRGQMGRECPLSTLLFHVLRWRSAQQQSPPNIHLVGHSYGAKVVTLAGMEAIRLQQNLVNPQVDHQDNEEVPLPPEKSITSLVLFNPAFHPRELHYLVHAPNPFSDSPSRANEVSLLQNISRKAIVYSARDYATGGIFDLGQAIFSNEIGQLATIPSTALYRLLEEYDNNLLLDFMTIPSKLESGILTLGVSVIAGTITWSLTKTFNIIPDWLSHSTQSDLYDAEWSKGPTWPKMIARTFLNAIDYWVPIGRVVTNADADKMGILRTAFPALGSIGMNRLATGPGKNYIPRFTFFMNMGTIDKLIGPDTDRRSGTNPDWDFCTLAAKVRPLDDKIDTRYFYSYDATSVMDTWFSMSGSHGDVRETAPPENCKDDTGQSLEKRRYIFNFVYNFTRGLPSSSAPPSVGCCRSQRH